MRKLAIGVVALVAACGGAQESSGPKGMQPMEPATIDPAQSKAAVETLVRGQYDAMGRLDFDAWSKALAPDALVLGTAPDEVMIGREGALAEAMKDFGEAKKNGAKAWTRSKDLRVTVSADGRAAWISDQLDFGMEMGAQKMNVQFRITQVLAEKDGAWWVQAAHFSFGFPNDQAFQRAAEGKWPALADIPDQVGDGADALAAEIDREIRDPKAFVAAVDDSPEVVVFGSAPEEYVVGGAQVRDMFQQQVQQFGVTMARAGSDRVAVTPDGQVGWAMTNLDFSVVFEGKTVTQPYRALLVYAKRGDAWKLVQAHFSNGIPDQ